MRTVRPLRIFLFSFFLVQLGYADTAENPKQIMLIPVNQISFELTPEEKVGVSKLGVKEVRLSKKEANHTSKPHAYVNEVTLFYLKGENTLIDESGKKIVARAGDSVFLPANTYVSSTSGPEGVIYLKVGEDLDKVNYKK